MPATLNLRWKANDGLYDFGGCQLRERRRLEIGGQVGNTFQQRDVSLKPARRYLPLQLGDPFFQILYRFTHGKPFDDYGCPFEGLHLIIAKSHNARQAQGIEASGRDIFIRLHWGYEPALLRSRPAISGRYPLWARYMPSIRLPAARIMKPTDSARVPRPRPLLSCGGCPPDGSGVSRPCTA